MNKPKTEKKRVPLGKPLPRPSERQAEAEANVSADDVLTANEWWRENAPAGYPALLDAKKDTAQ